MNKTTESAAVETVSQMFRKKIYHMGLMDAEQSTMYLVSHLSIILFKTSTLCLVIKKNRMPALAQE